MRHADQYISHVPYQPFFCKIWKTSDFQTKFNTPTVYSIVGPFFRAEHYLKPADGRWKDSNRALPQCRSGALGKQFPDVHVLLLVLQHVYPLEPFGPLGLCVQSVLTCFDPCPVCS